jgi:DNA (cytosine-5)-methyltransferase 1
MSWLMNMQLAMEGQDSAAVDVAWAEPWREFLVGPQEIFPETGQNLRLADLFSGAGGLALGFKRAALARGVGCTSTFAADTDERALKVYTHNLGTAHCSSRSVAGLVDFQIRGQGSSARFAYEPELVGDAEKAPLGQIDVVLAGPPCQGHSSLNNRTRGDDPRNRLYLTVPAFAVASGARAIIIENVPGVVRSRGNVVETAEALLEGAGYCVTRGKLASNLLGWPQTRQRYFLVALKGEKPVPLPQVMVASRHEALPISWAIGDLLERELGAADALHVTADLSAENAARIAWLFANDAFDMPNHLRPECHQEGTTYGSVYGRMRWDRPAPTLTTGFLTPGRGRYIHPLRPRTLTAREAARIQGFPDWYDFSAGGALLSAKTDHSKWIGNAVPSILGFTAAQCVLDSLVD